MQKIIQALPASFSASIIIGQHIAEEFIPSFVSQLNNMSAIAVVSAEQGLKVESGIVYVCSGITRIVSEFDRLVFYQSSTMKGRFNPDIDTLFLSVVDISTALEVLSIILTGMGGDGAQGSKMLSAKGASCIAECESSAIVNGMPDQARKLNKDIAIKNLDEIIQTIIKFGQS